MSAYIHITFIDNDDAQLKAMQAVGILNKLRDALTMDDQYSSYDTRSEVKKWRERADEFLTEVDTQAINNQTVST